MASTASRENEPPVAVQPKKSPPLAFQPTSNDALYAPVQSAQRALPYFHSPDYLTSPAARRLSRDGMSSPKEYGIESQLRRQSEALRLQHQAFLVERECWDMERERLLHRIASLESLLKSPNGHSPARSPVVPPLVNGNISSEPLHTTTSTVPPHRSSSTSTVPRLASIAEDDVPASHSTRRSPSFSRRNAPQHIELPSQTPAYVLEEDVDESAAIDLSDPPSPPATRQTQSPAPIEYLKHAGHTPLRMASRPNSSSNDSPARRALFQEGLEDTPTRRNTALNLISAREEDEEPSLSGPLHLPELPHAPTEINFTLDALSARLHYIEEHPAENEPLALSARSNRDDADDDVDASDLTLKAATEKEDTPSLSHSDASVTGVSPPPASETSIASAAFSRTFSPREDEVEHRGIRLKKKSSSNFGAPFGQLRP